MYAVLHVVHCHFFFFIKLDAWKLLSLTLKKKNKTKTNPNYLENFKNARLKQERYSVLNCNYYNQFRHEYPTLIHGERISCSDIKKLTNAEWWLLQKPCLFSYWDNITSWNNVVNILVSFKCYTLVLLVLLPLNMI